MKEEEEDSYKRVAEDALRALLAAYLLEMAALTREDGDALASAVDAMLDDATALNERFGRLVLAEELGGL